MCLGKDHAASGGNRDSFIGLWSENQRKDITVLVQALNMMETMKILRPGEVE